MKSYQSIQLIDTTAVLARRPDLVSAHHQAQLTDTFFAFQGM